MAYMPDVGVGYFYSINSGSGVAFQKAGKLIRAYITRGLQKPAVPAVGALPANAAEYAGWYEAASPRIELMHILDRLLGMARLSFDHGQLLFFSLGGKDEYLPVAGEQFREISKKDSPHPVATLELLRPNAEGQFIQLGLGMGTMRRIPGWFAISEIVLTAFVLLAVISILIYAPFWILGGLSKKRRRPAERGMRIWPLVAVLSLIGIVGVFMLASDDLIELLGNLTAASLSLFLLTVLFGAASLMSAIAIWRAPKPDVRAKVRIYSTVVTAALLIAAAYLAYWGIIGVRTWA